MEKGMREYMMKVSPESVGLSSTRLHRIDKLMQCCIDKGICAGGVAMVARKNKIVYHESFGLMDIKRGKPVQKDTIFRICSMTKPIICVAIMMLYEEGYFQMDTPVSRFVPEFKNMKVIKQINDKDFRLVNIDREITIHDLLVHTSGLSYDIHTEELTYRLNLSKEKFEKEHSIGEFIKILTTLPLAHQPGEKWSYGYSTDVLGYIIEVISQKSLRDFLKQQIFDPLGMVDTDFFVREDKHDRLSELYTFSEEHGFVLVESGVDYRKKPLFCSGGGGVCDFGSGLVSTAEDYIRFAQMLLNKGELDGNRILGRKTVEFMTMNHLSSNLLPMITDKSRPYDYEGYGYGLGWKVLLSSAQAGIIGTNGMYGWGGNAKTEFFIDPKEELIALYMTQCIPYQQIKEFQTVVYQALID
ncbi:serine hydrolase domain-containing protein [Acetivibrio clariflavus]|uniref:serine hydrolase domain-containing protein n=1 Tax=Acetivibrio clariflavus TaxID=288965 RepID=UPI0031F52BFE